MNRTRLFRAAFCFFAIVLSVTVARAQNEANDTPSDTPAAVVVTQPPATKLDALDRGPGLTVRGLTKVGDVPDDSGGKLTVFAVTVDDRMKAPLRGLALLVTAKSGAAARAYVDEEEIAPLIEGVKALAKLDRGATPMTDSRGVYRTLGNVTILNVDDNGSRTAIVRTMQVSPLTGQVSVAAARYRSVRLNEILRQLQNAKEVLDKTVKE
ncbi:MAG: hypothetical protein JWM57_4387 [Phycisphaerales bacterium]|nr:hypothetical protein [Phycisphaerales bacterium]